MRLRRADPELRDRRPARLDRRPVLVGTFFVGLFVLQFAVMLFLPRRATTCCSCGPTPTIASALTKVQYGRPDRRVARRRGRDRRSAGARPRGRAGARCCRASPAACAACCTPPNLTTLLAGLARRSPLVWVLNTALLTVPAALLWGLLRSRLARGGLADLFRELGTLRGVRLEAGLAKTLGDPGLVLAYRVPGERSYIDGSGQPVDAARAGWRPYGGADRARRPRARRCSSTTRRSTTIRSSSRPSPPRPRSRSTTRGCRPSPRTGSPSCAPRASASSPPATRSGGGSSATSTTGRSSGSCPWRSSCG